VTAGARNPAIAVVPRGDPEVLEAVEEGGGRLVEHGDAKGVMWTDPAHPEGLKELLESSPAEWIQLPFAGIEKFVEADAIDPGRTWTCAKGIYGPTCAEHSLAFMLAAGRLFHKHIGATSWAGEENERRLKTATVLIVGTGGIGKALASMLRPIGPRVLAVNRSGRPLEGAERTEPTDALPDLLPEADFVVLAASLTPQTRHMFDGTMFGHMRGDAWLLNVARGGLVDTDALVGALESGEIGGAALDVTEPEPLPDGHPLWAMPHVIITPHVANTWSMGLPELAALVKRNVQRYGRGEELEGLVDPSLGY
jgi:phosphoglycerate dehydrogenase-like enzyme